MCFSRYLSENGKIDTIEMDEERAKTAVENIKKMELQNTINVITGNAVEILPTLKPEYDVVFIDAAKSKYPIFLQEALRLLSKDGIIFADNVLYKGYVLGDYNKHKQRTAVNHLREFIKLATENDKLDTKILEIGDGLAIIKK
ncbi:MAG: class I SAM-dependent methyltransferase [Clostridia bacterium]|nr:class I SAM-dependent methyltransferase [Clostridia bacterium]